jgi:hypothetical protein
MAMWRIARIGLVVAVALAILAGVGWYLYGGPWREQYEARVAALRAEGQPTRFEDLAPPPIPDEENGAKLLEEAHRILEERRRAPGSADDLLYKDRSAEEKAALAAYLESLKPYFDLLAQVPQRPGWRPDLDWNAGINNLVDLYAQLSDAHHHVVARAEVDPEETGRTERAAHAAVLMLALGAKCRGPFLIGHLVSESVASDAEEILRAAMRQPRFDAALFRRIVDPPLARSTSERWPLKSVFAQERVFGIAAVEAARAGAPYLSRGKERTVSFLELPALYREATRFLDVIEKAIAHGDATPEGAIIVARDLASESHAHSPILGDVSGIYSRTFLLFADNIASRRLTRVAMALLEHRQREGAWPESLAELGEMPMDPHGGGPFRYERTEGGCRVRAAKDDAPDDLEEDFLAWTLRDDQIPAIRR